MARIGFAKGTKNDRLTDIPFPLPLNQIVVPNRRTATSNEEEIKDDFCQSWETVTLLNGRYSKSGTFWLRSFSSSESTLFGGPILKFLTHSLFYTNFKE